MLTRPLAALALAAATVSSPARGAGFEAVPESGRIVVHVFKTGFLAGFAHDHHFDVTEWRATADLPDGDLARARVALVMSAGSLRDRQTALTEKQRQRVDGQAAGPEVLDAEHHPHIEYRADRLTIDGAPGDGGKRVHGTLHGTLDLRGQGRPVDVAVEAQREAEGWRVHARARVKQSEFGIRPYRRIGGSIGVKDELEIEIDLTLRPPEAHASRGD